MSKEVCMKWLLYEKKDFERIFSTMSDMIAIEQLVPVIERLHVGKLQEGGAGSFQRTVAGSPLKDVTVCPQSFYYLQINLDGDVVPCCAEQVPLHLGNLADLSLQEIWNGETLRELWKRHLQKNKNFYPACRACQQYPNSMFPEDCLDDDAERLLSAMQAEP